MAEFIQKTDTLNQGREKLNEAIKDADKAKADAGAAVNTSNQAKQIAQTAENKADSVQAQFDQVVIEGDSSVEAAQARVDTEGVSHPTLKARLDAEHSEVTAQLADAVQEVQNTKLRVLNFTKYGRINLSSDFPALPFLLFRDFDGIVKHDFNLNDYRPTRKIYWKSTDSSNSNDGLSPATPVTTWSRVLEIINSVSEGAVDVIFMDKFANYDSIDTTKIIDLPKTVWFSSYHDEGTVIGTTRTNFTWTPDGNLFKTSRTVAKKVFDYNRKDRFGLPVELKQVGTLEACRNEKNTWYTDNSTVWVNRDMPAGFSNTLAIGLALALRVRINIGNNSFGLNNVHFFTEHADSVNYPGLTVIGDSSSRFYAYNVSFRYASNNGLSVEGVGKSFIFNSHAIKNLVDGFNYHGSGEELVFEYNCYASDNGTPTESSANATTAHDGMYILRVGCIGERCYGPILADVNGCYSIAIDCRMYNSLLTRGSAFYFSDTGAETPGIAYLINCDGGGGDTYTIVAYTDNPVKVVNLGGNNIEASANVEFVESIF